MILGETVSNETIEDSTIKVYPDLTSKCCNLINLIINANAN